MKCPRCLRENAEGSQFCSFCGSGLEGLPAEERRTSGEARLLEEQLAELRRVLAHLTDRVAALERLQGTASMPALQREPAARPISATTPPPIRETLVTSAPDAGAAAQPRPPAPAVGRGPAGPAYPPRGRHIDWEDVLGRNWLAIIGALALIVGLGFFLRLAFENNWIGERGRIILGIATGLALMGAGEYTQRRYPAWAHAATGGGTAILYLSLYASFGFYQIINPLPILLLLTLVVFASGLLAVRYESLVIALLSITGAFVTPVLLGRDLEPDQRYLLLVYILVVDLGILGVATFRNWRWFTLLGLVASYILFAMWIQYIPARDLVLAQLGLAGIFLIMVGATTLFHIFWRRVPGGADLALMTLNAVAFYAGTFRLLWDRYEAWFGLITVALALFYGLVGYGALRRPGVPPQVSLFALAIALVFLTIAVPLQLGGSWVTVAWAAEGAVLIWVGFLARSGRIRAFALGVFAVAAFRLLVFDTPVGLQGFRPVLNERFLTFAFAVVATYIGAYLYAKRSEHLQEWERYVYLVLVGAANLLTVWILSAEIISYFDSRQVRLSTDLTNAKHLSLTISWAVYAIGIIGAGIVRRSGTMRLAGIALLGVPVAKLFVYDVFLLERGYRVVAFVTLGVLLLASGLAYQRYSKAIRGFLHGK